MESGWTGWHLSLIHIFIPNLELQDEFARYYADVAGRSGLGLYDFDGQEFLFFNGMGGYSVKRFYRTMFDQAKKLNLPADIRFTGAGLSEGSWHYQSVWNVGGGKNIYCLLYTSPPVGEIPLLKMDVCLM